MAQNPYMAPVIEEPARGLPMSSLHPSVARMWVGYGVAPVVAPLAFIGQLVLIVLLAERFNLDLNNASLVFLPVLALSVGLVACYGVAGVIGMPLAFVLRRRRRLNAFYIHLCALGWALVFAFGCQVFLGKEGLSLGERAFLCAYVFSGTAAPILLSATAFWLVVRRWASVAPDRGNA